MKLNNKYILAAVMLLTFAFVAAAQSKMTAKDYFLAIPSEYINLTKAQRTQMIDRDASNPEQVRFVLDLKALPNAEREMWGDAEVWGEVVVFKGNAKNTIVAMVINRCAEGECMGQPLFLDYKAGTWTNVSEKIAPEINNDEIIEILKNAPAWENPIEDDSEIPLTVGFFAPEGLINYIAGGKAGNDGGVVAKIFKWNGSKFMPFEYPEGV